MPWIYTNYSYNSVSFDYLAVSANPLHGGHYFHCFKYSKVNNKIYFALNVIRARVRSYGVRSTVTLSPGKIRM
jgi:hypothetical protein